ncbi:Gfo/Idh/MocA family protein [Arthrobacter sp. STN4]|uniref:Gfo/Idh/MocA family protein n=1 Tax=Arthrobacter sp. STN4 TaxID=2923276 RepID=UPI00211A0465|nr:Gfo/Idh/MocA family oxidoreductase [Arthrobacter sp. STN4]MCQ9165428.1 Gfo/Idh/MocA family oxidoreductase [Arthrobacter sp. STN4]
MNAPSRTRRTQSTPHTGELRVGIIGCGAIAANHADAYASQDGVHVTVCMDTDPERAQAFAWEHGVPAWTTDANGLLSEVDAVSVCTPHPTHEALVLQAARAGVHVLCEKPLAIDVPAAERMVNACRAAGVRLGGVFQRRYWPAAQRIRAAIDDGTLGTPVLARVEVLLHRDTSYYTGTPWRGKWKSDGGGVAMTQAIHYLDLLQWYLGDVEWVMATAAAYKHGAHIEVEDTLAATLRFSSGAMAQFTASTALTPALGQRIAVTGASGATVSLLEYPEGSEAVNDVWSVPGSELFAFPADVLDDVDLPSVNAALAPFHTLQVADFVRAVQDGREPAVTGADALRSLRTLAAMYASLRSGLPERPDGPPAAAPGCGDARWPVDVREQETGREVLR